MVTARLISTTSCERQTSIEAYFQTTLEHHFRLLRERIPALVESDGTLPVTFWMQARDEFVAGLLPVYEIGLAASLQAEFQNPYFPAQHFFVNIHARLQEIALHMVRELAQKVTLTAAQCVHEAFTYCEDRTRLPETLRYQLRLGTLSEARAERMAVHEAGRIAAASATLLRRAVPFSSDVRRNKPKRLFV